MVQKVLYVSIITIICSSILWKHSSKSILKHFYANLNVQEFIEKYEYPVEVHDVITEDGYILTLQRIPHGRRNISTTRIPVLLVHGILQSAWDFIQGGPNHSLPFLLTEKGYDVWLGNLRGTTWSRNHKSLDPDEDSSFWNYTLEEIATFDLPTIIDYILDTTRQESLHYIGFSQGTTAFFMMGSEKSDYLDKIKLMTAFAPAVFMKNPKNPIAKFIAYNWRLGEMLFSFFNYQELFGRSDPFVMYMRYICKDENSIFMDLCMYSSSIVFGKNYDEIDKSTLSLTTFTGASLKQALHIYQMIDSGNFCKYDFGNNRNLEVYGQKNPPHYNLSKVTTPVALYYSTNDHFIDITNIDRLASALPNVVRSYKVPAENFSHNDFLLARDVVNLLYDTAMDEIAKY